MSAQRSASQSGSAPATQRALLQALVALAGLVPVAAGGIGVVLGLPMIDAAGDVSADSQYRYLSGLLLGIGLLFWASIPRIERHTNRFRVLTAIVFAGGLARLNGLAIGGVPDAPMLFGLGMELCVTPAICFWQGRVAAAAARHPAAPDVRRGPASRSPS